MNKLKVGQIGIGHNHGSAKMETFRKLSDIYEVVGVAEADPAWREKRGDLKEYAGLEWTTEEELLGRDDVSVIAVETDVPDLVDTAMRCIEAGKHIHLDKPAGTTLGPFKRLLEEAERRDLVVQMGYMYRNNPAVEICFRAVREGWLGRVFEIHTVMNRIDNEEYRQWLLKFGCGGAMYIFGSHLIDLVISMMGRPDRIHAFQKNTWPDMDDLNDNGLAVFEYPNATATVRAAVVEHEGYKRRQLIVCGDEGSIEIKPLEPPVMRMTLAKDHGEFKAGCHDVPLRAIPGRYDEQITELAQVIRGEIPNPYPPAHDLLVQECTLLASGYTL